MSVKIKSRKQHASGKTTNAVRSAAYRHKCAMNDIKNGGSYDYSHLKNEFVDSFIMMNDDIKKAFSNTYLIQKIKNSKLSEREKNAMVSQWLWSSVEETEKRKDSQLFREVEVSLYHDLTLAENKKLLKSFIKENFTSRGMIADVAIHDSGDNLHAHIMLTMRDFDCQKCCFSKKNRDWNKLDLVEKWRADWSKKSEKALNREIYHKSFVRMADEAFKNGEENKAKFFLKLDECKAFHVAKTQLGNKKIYENRDKAYDKLVDEFEKKYNEQEQLKKLAKITNLKYLSMENQLDFLYKAFNNISFKIKGSAKGFYHNNEIKTLRNELREKRKLEINVYNKLQRAEKAAKSSILRGADAIRHIASNTRSIVARSRLFINRRIRTNVKFDLEHRNGYDSNQRYLSSDKTFDGNQKNYKQTFKMR
ncbi:MobA/MobL family protein (plasmid) [Avibacterium paragallinarum]|uniref:MobA/MobL family protein n=1 Tax=Avibacterium paragallinarum TaxID=728 RepID=UPI0021E1E6A8|nr:MobA/MobL family protein [Avibacterium paragallinarum]UXN35796.1 MobA/MobL family protein [Avibacterium paragallinarum]